MAFIEMTGEMLDRIIADDELHHENLDEAGVKPSTIVREFPLRIADSSGRDEVLAELCRTSACLFQLYREKRLRIGRLKGIQPILTAGNRE